MNLNVSRTQGRHRRCVVGSDCSRTMGQHWKGGCSSEMSNSTRHRSGDFNAKGERENCILLQSTETALTKDKLK